MLDHAFLDAISATRLSLEAAMLERVAVEEQFQTDVLLGDLNFETSYALPGNQKNQTASVVTDIAMGWSSFSQAAMRSLFIGESPDEDPSVMLSVTFRVRDLRAAPDAAALRATLSDDFPDISGSSWHGPSLSMTTLYLKGSDMFNFSVSFDGEVLLNEDTLVSDRGTEKVFAPLGQWVASRLVKLSDYPFDFEKQPSRK